MKTASKTSKTYLLTVEAEDEQKCDFLAGEAMAELDERAESTHLLCMTQYSIAYDIATPSTGTREQLTRGRCVYSATKVFL